MLIDGIYKLLAADAALMALLSGGVHKVLLPEGACLPAMTFQGAGGSGSPTFNGSGMQKARIQFDVRGRTLGEAHRILDTLRLLLNGYRGALQDDDVIFVQNAELINPVPMDFPLEQYTRDFRSMSEYYFYFTFSTGY